MERETLVVICKRLFPAYFKEYSLESETKFQKAIIKTLQLESGDSAFIKFLEQYENVSEFIPEEDKRIAAAKKAAKVTTEQINEAISLHHKALAGIVEKIEANLKESADAAKEALKENESAAKLKVDNANAELLDLQSKIESKKSEIERIKAEAETEAKEKKQIIEKSDNNKVLADAMAKETAKVLNSFIK